VALSINGHTLMCFIDTGSEATLIKPAPLRRLDPEHNLTYEQSNKVIHGVTGSPLYPQAEVRLHFNLGDRQTLQHATLIADLPFPGDMLIGIDFLRRVDFTLSAEC